MTLLAAILAWLFVGLLIDAVEWNYAMAVREREAAKARQPYVPAPFFMGGPSPATVWDRTRVGRLVTWPVRAYGILRSAVKADLWWRREMAARRKAGVRG